MNKSLCAATLKCTRICWNQSWGPYMEA